MTADRVAERAEAAGLRLTPSILQSAVEYYELLQRWNQTINLTGLPDSADAIDRLLIEPLAASAFLPSHGTLMDIGSGGGSPAIPLAIASSAQRLVMIESRGRKAAFLREAARQLNLPAEVVSDRAETLAAKSTYAHAADVVSLRAVRVTPSLAAAIKGLLHREGRLALFGRPGGAIPEGFVEVSRQPLPPVGLAELHLCGLVR